MSDFPLLSFLLSLERDGIFLAVRDYDRIAHVLSTDGTWTLRRLRHVLVSLLAKDVDQRDLLQRRFDDAFESNLPELATKLNSDLDIQKLIVELQRIKPEPVPVRVTNPPRNAPFDPPPTMPWWKKRLTRISVLVGLLVLLVGLGYYNIPVFISLPEKPSFQIDPPSQISSAEPGKERQIDLAVVNLGGGQLQLGKISLEAEGFSLVPHTCSGRRLAAGQRCAFSVKFRSDNPGQFTANLRAFSESDLAESQIIVNNSPKGDDPLPIDQLGQLPVIDHIPRKPVLGSIDEIPNISQDAWRNWAWATLVFALLLVGYSVYLRRYQKLPIDSPPPWNGDLARHFPFERVGGAPLPRLDRTTLAHLADSMGYFHSERVGHRPDIPASVLATVRQGGIPSLHFLQTKQLRQLVILEDGQAGAIAQRNPLASELSEGLGRLGVEVLHGKYFSDPAVAWDLHGAAFYLDDLESHRNGLLLLLVGEAGRVRGKARLSLERLARWPHSVWMDLTPDEQLGQPPSLPERCGLAVYPATADGLLNAFARLLSETASQKQMNRRPVAKHSLPFKDNVANLEIQLGDALPWAAACALVQPFSYGLADRLRRKFFPHLPADRVERLVALPGSTSTAEGLRFGDAQTQALQGLFFQRLPEELREAILKCLMQLLQVAWNEQLAQDPELAESPASLAWERRYQQIRLALEPAEALKRLSELNGTPLAAAIRQDMNRLVVHLPRPEDRISQQRLARLAPASDIPKIKRFSLRRWQRALAGMLVIGVIGAFGLSLYFAWQLYQGELSLVVTAEADLGTKVRLTAMNAESDVREFPRLPLAVRVLAGKDWRLELVDVQDVSFELKNLSHDSRVNLGFEPAQSSPALNATLIVTDLAGHSLKAAKVHLRAAGDVQSYPADRQIRLPAGEWEVKLVSDDGFETGWRKLNLIAGERLQKPIAYDRIFRDRFPDGSLGPLMVSLPGGTFNMGENSFEGPGHPVTLDAFAIGTREVSFTEYDLFAKTTGRPMPRDSGFGRGDRPVINVSWDDAVAYAAWLSQQTGTEYRLPSEAQWEYAARAGTESYFWWGDDYAFGLANCQNYSKTLPTASFAANAFGLYDTAGNVSEWVSDWHASYEASDKPLQNPQGPAQGSSRVIRGGSWNYSADYCRSAIRSWIAPSYRSFYLGFRLSRTDPLPSYPLTLDEPNKPEITREDQATSLLPFSDLRDKMQDGSDGPVMVVLPAGSFKMGSPNDEAGHQSDEDPLHEVKLQKFAMSRFEVTVAEYMRFVRATNSHQPEWLEQGSQYNIKTGNDDHYKKLGDALQDPTHPIVGIAWDDALAYVQWLSQKTGQSYRLPSEAEWEYAARAGSGQIFPFGDNSADLGKYAWYADNANAATHRVGKKLANAFGLYDMQGNVSEWVNDWYGEYPKSSVPVAENPTGPATGSDRVIRGGSWSLSAGYCRSALRYGLVPSYRDYFLGFRLSRTLP